MRGGGCKDRGDKLEERASEVEEKVKENSPGDGISTVALARGCIHQAP